MEETGSIKVQLHHKEESTARVQADKKDRDGLRKRILFLTLCQHPDGDIVNTVNRKTTSACVNMGNTVLIGKKMLTDFEKTWPERLYTTLFIRLKGYEDMKICSY